MSKCRPLVQDDLAQYEQYKLDEFEAPPVAGDDFMPQQTDAAGFTATTELTAEQAMKDAFFEFLLLTA